MTYRQYVLGCGILVLGAAWVLLWRASTGGEAWVPQDDMTGTVQRVEMDATEVSGGRSRLAVEDRQDEGQAREERIIRGVVVTENGGGIESATVSVWYCEESEERVAETTTDGQGVFAVSISAKTQWPVCLRVMKEGYAEQIGRYAKEDIGVIVLKAGTMCVVEVRSKEDDAPLVGAVVSVKEVRSDKARWYPVMSWAGRTDASGRFTVRYYGDQRLYARGHASGRDSADAVFSRSEEGVVLRLGKVGTIKGTLVGWDGVAIGGAAVVAEWGPLSRAETKQDGKFEIAYSGERSMCLYRVESPGFAIRWVRVSREDAQDGDIGNVVLEKGASLVGKINGFGEDVNVALMVEAGDTQTTQYWLARKVRAKDELFEVQGLPVAGVVYVTVKDGEGRCGFGMVELGMGERRLHLEAEACGTVVAKLADAFGEGVVVRFVVERPSSSAWSPAPMRLADLWCEATGGEEVTVRVPAGELCVEAWKGSMIGSAVAGVGVGQSVRVVLSGGGSITGTVKDEGGTPCETMVAIDDGTGREIRTARASAETGFFRFDGTIVERNYILTVHRLPQTAANLRIEDVRLEGISGRGAHVSVVVSRQR